MGEREPGEGRGKWMALTAALLGWMFDGFEIGLFPVVAAPALENLIALSGSTTPVADWNAMVNFAFLVGAATGGVIFGWLGDRIGRVRAMSLSILTYALCSGLGGLAGAPWHMVAIRFVAALGMGGEWSLGVALVMEVWGGRSREMLAGVIGAAANVGFGLVALLSLGLGTLRPWLASLGLAPDWVEWRLLMVCGALPALLVFFIRLFVPESASWEKEKARGATSSWASRDLLTVVAGIGVCALLLVMWRLIDDLAIRLIAALAAVALVAGLYLYPTIGYLRRAGEAPAVRDGILRRMLLAALISSVPLLVTWGAVQNAPAWAVDLGKEAVEADPSRKDEVRFWKEYTQAIGAAGAVIGCIAGALLAGVTGRRLAYIVLCLTSLGSVLLFYGNTTFGPFFLFSMFLVGFFTASFYGWLPLFLPELFPTRVRATGQGFGFNFGRILAAVGVLATPLLMGEPRDFARGGSTLAFIYLVGLGVIWLAPETRGKPLPE